MPAYSGICEGDIKAIQFFIDSGGHLLDIFEIGGVSLYRQSLRSEFFDRSVKSLLIASGDRDSSTLGCEQSRCCETYFTVPAGDQCVLTE